MNASSDKVVVDVDDALMTITINRPQVRNAIDGEVSHAVAAAIDELDARDDLRVGILTGAGGTFCSGMDLKAFLDGESTDVEGRGLLGITATPPTKPLIAAVEGWALAGGFEAVLACDLVVASREAQLGLPEAKWGLSAAAGGLLRLPRVIPPRIAMEIALTGDLFPAEVLHRHGLINVLVDPGHAVEAAVALAHRIIANAPLSVAASKRVMVEQRTWSDADQWERQAVITDAVNGSADAREGAAAFKEKRPPRWRGE